MQYRNVLTLNVDWNSKAVSISSPSGESIAFDGYSILSNSGGLSTSQWNSLQDQGAAGWVESTPTNTALNELNQNVGGSLSIGSTPRGLGTAFNPVIGPLGQSPEDLRFEYTIPSTGEIIEGLVNYTGNRIVNNLALIVDPTTGKAQLKNSTPNPLSFDGYSVLSASNSLLPANGKWSSLFDQGTVPWQEANAATNWLNELRTSGFTTLAAGQTLNLGELFNKAGGLKDLVLEFALQGELGPRLGTVIYAPLSTAVPGDYNGNGKVDAADYTVWRDTFGATGSGLAADGNGDNTVNGLDYTYWKTRFGNTSGSGSGLVRQRHQRAGACIARHTVRGDWIGSRFSSCGSPHCLIGVLSSFFQVLRIMDITVTIAESRVSQTLRSSMDTPHREECRVPAARLRGWPLGRALATRGFTLVELLVVIAIIGILVALLVAGDPGRPGGRAAQSVLKWSPATGPGCAQSPRRA